MEERDGLDEWTKGMSSSRSDPASWLFMKKHAGRRVIKGKGRRGKESDERMEMTKRP